MKRILLNLLKFTLFLGTGLGILYLVYRSQNRAYQAECGLKGIAAEDCSLVHKVFADFASANYWWLLLVLVAFTISNLSRAVRWNMLIHQLGYRPRLINSFLTIVLGYFANMGLPRVGEVVRAGALARYERIPPEKVMGTVVVDRIIDVISILLVTALAVFLEFGRIRGFINAHVNLGDRLQGGQGLLWLGLLGVAGLGVLYALRGRLRRSKLYHKIMALAQGFGQGLRTVGKLDRPWLFALHSVNIWLMYYLMTYLCFFAYGPTAHLGALAALVVFVFGGWGIVIPSPGGMGTYHFLAQTALALYGIAGEDGFSWANISFFTIQLGCNVLVGLLALVWLPVLNRAQLDAAPPTHTTN